MHVNRSSPFPLLRMSAFPEDLPHEFSSLLRKCLLFLFAGFHFHLFIPWSLPASLLIQVNLLTFNHTLSVLPRDKAESCKPLCLL